MVNVPPTPRANPSQSFQLNSSVMFSRNPRFLNACRHVLIHNLPQAPSTPANASRHTAKEKGQFMFSGSSHNNNNDHNRNRNVMPKISTPSKCIKSLVSIPYERQTHLGDMFVAESIRLRAIGRTVVRLIDLVQWEVGDINVG